MQDNTFQATALSWHLRSSIILAESPLRDSVVWSRIDLTKGFQSAVLNRRKPLKGAVFNREKTVEISISNREKTRVISGKVSSILLTIPRTSVRAERDSSVLSHILEKRQSSLKSQPVDDIFFHKDAFQYNAPVLNCGFRKTFLG